MVLLKAYDKVGFSFYTNYHSKKGRDLEANPKAAMLFFWPKVHWQVSSDCWICISFLVKEV
jgi:pyridoxamine 5'-phosphate oxidase